MTFSLMLRALLGVILGLLAGRLALASLREGRITARRITYVRHRQPLRFWISASLIGLGSIALLGMGGWLILFGSPR